MKDAFDVLGLAPRFSLDVTTLEQRYRDLQKQLHPDKFVNASSSARRQSLSHAVTVNDAYRTLRDDLKRAELLLARRGLAFQEASADPELLMEVMELREDLASAKQRRDLSRAQALSQQVAGRERDARSTLQTVLDDSDAGDTHAAARALTRLRYYRRFQDEVTSLEDDLSE